MSHRRYAVYMSTACYHLTCVMLNIRSRIRAIRPLSRSIGRHETPSDGGLSNGFYVADAEYSTQ